MEQKLETLKLLSFDKNNLEHNVAKRKLLNDDEFKKYFGEFFIKDADNYFNNSDKIELKKVYFIEEKDNIVGMIRFFSYHELGYVNIQYAVLPEYRCLGYGRKILSEMTKYIMNDSNIKCIEADIDKTNIGSIKIATSLGYNKENDKYKFRR